MTCSMPGFPVPHCLPEFAQTHVHQVSDAIQPSHPLLSPSPVALNLFPASGSFPVSQLFISGDQSIGASTLVLPMNIQDWFPLGLTGLIFCCPRDSQESCPAPQFRIIDSRSKTLSNISFIFLIHASSLFICESILFSRFWIILLSLFWILFQVDYIFPPLFFSLLGFYHVPLSAVYFSVFSFCLIYCDWGLLSAD